MFKLLSRLSLIIALVFVSAFGAVAQNPPATPDTQVAPAPAISFHIQVIVSESNPVGDAVATSIHKLIAQPPAGISITDGQPDKDDPSGVNARLLLVNGVNKDHSNNVDITFTALVIVYHRKGFTQPLYISTYTGFAATDEAEALANDLINLVATVTSNIDPADPRLASATPMQPPLGLYARKRM